MTEQANTGWGLTVSRLFKSESDAKNAVQSLRQAGFIEGEIRVWKQREPAVAQSEDGLARLVEGLLAGGVIGGLLGLFASVAMYWSLDSNIPEERVAIAAVVSAGVGAIVTALAVSIVSRRVAFSHPHEEHAGGGSVVTVTVGDRAAQARQVFDSIG